MNKKDLRQLCHDYQEGKLRVDQFTDAIEKLGIPSDITFVIHDLHREVSYQTNYRKLSAEDQVIAAKWREEHNLRRQALAKMSQAKGDPQAEKKALEEYLKIGNEHMCSHERSIWSRCAGCEHIENTLYPDMFTDEDEEELDEDE